MYAKKWVTASLHTFELAAKSVGIVGACRALLGFLVPPIGNVVNLVTAWRFGAVGYVYYEVGPNRTLTDDGRFYLLRAGDGRYQDISIGDRLQAVDEVHFRVWPTGNSPTIFLLGFRDCVIVLGRDHEVSVTPPHSGGWLKVATTACGLFK